MGKRYYWLKLNNDFFQDKKIKKLRKIAGGDTYTIIYLKLMLKTLETGGIIEFEGIESTFAEEVALVLDEESDNVQVALNYLESTGLLIDMGERQYLLPYAEESIGGENAATARVREYRQRQKALHCNADVTPMKHFCNAEKEIEIEKEIEKEIEIEKEREKEKEKNTKKEKTKDRACALDEPKPRKAVYYPLDEKLDKAIGDFVEMRKKMKSPMTERAIDLFIRKLDGMANDNGEKIAIVEQSIMNGWKSVYPLKETKSKSGNIFADIAAELENENPFDFGGVENDEGRNG